MYKQANSKYSHSVSSAKTPPPPQEGVMSVAQNCILWWGGNSGALGTVQYSLIAITPRSTLTLGGSTCKGLKSKDQTDVWKLLVLDRNT